VPYTHLYRVPGQKGEVVGDDVTLTALLEDARGHILALAQNGGNSSLVDLIDNRRLDLSDYGVFAASLAADGSIYALLITNDATRTYEVARIDEQDMSLTTLIPVTVDPDAGNDSLILVSTQSGLKFLYVTQELPFPKDSKDHPTPNAQQSYLYRIDPGPSAAVVISLPNSIGIYAALGIDGNIYFYGGFAGPSVSMYDVANSSFTGEVARAPEGSYVQAVFVR
jgi:hypothetical protein